MRKNYTNNKIEGNMETNVNRMYHLIILDESGSMSCVRERTISGCNETLAGIRTIAKENPGQEQVVSIYCFDSQNSRYILRNESIDDVKEITAKDYRPNACTPLYDAVGDTVSALRMLTDGTDSIAAVTIITDGMENSSLRWTQSQVLELIEGLKAKGWVFTFIGANIDEMKVSIELGITSCLKWEQDDEGTREMFERERRSRQAFMNKQRMMRESDEFLCASVAEREEMMSRFNRNYFVEEGDRVAPDNISHLESNEIFVFGSNINGNHAGGAAARAAKRFGAEMGRGEGPQGESYAIPTVGVSLAEVEMAIERFAKYAALNPDKKFLLTAIGCGRAGFRIEEIAPLFRTAYGLGNVYVPAVFLNFVK